MPGADIGLIGLGVMGRNLALNMADHGFAVAGFDVDSARASAFPGARAASLHDLARQIKKPRTILLMVPAGRIVDEVIAGLVASLEPGDIVVDGGNSHYADSARRAQELESRGLRFVGMGVSGGEEGARNGPSLMPGGAADAWPLIRDLFLAIAARAKGGAPCCAWIGPGGSGHFVKMVHNGIEYADLQLIGEAYAVLRNMLGLSPPDLEKIFGQWNQGELESYLIEITSRIFARKDPETGSYLVDVILDAAGQKGTGKWTTAAALDLGVSAPTIAEAVFARFLSAAKEDRVAAARVLQGPAATFDGDRDSFVEAVRQALYASKICAYAQGFALLLAASNQFGWGLKPGEIALLWREGCIIRAAFLDRIQEAYERNRAPSNLLLDPYFMEAMARASAGWRRVVAQAVGQGIPVPAFSSALAYFDGCRSAWLPANLLQAQRDFFGAHAYERVDRPRGKFFHTDWL